MKSVRIFCLLLCIALMLTACFTPSAETPISTFFYIRPETEFESESIFITEVRNVQAPLKDLLILYLSGPLDEYLQSPFPMGTTLIDCTIIDAQVEIILSNEASSLTGIELSVACCALAKTCFTNSDVSAVNISTQSALLNGQKTISFTEAMFYPT